MSDPFGIVDGTKQVTKTLNESVKASEELSKAIDGVLAVADKAAKERAASRKKSSKRSLNAKSKNLLLGRSAWLFSGLAIHSTSSMRNAHTAVQTWVKPISMVPANLSVPSLSTALT